MTPAAILGYWDMRGWVQPIRHLLKYVDVKFVDKLYECGPAPIFDKSCWLNEKYSLGLDFPNLPYYIEGDVKLTHSIAIMRHIARKHGLDGKTETEKDRIEIAAEEMVDWRHSWTNFCYGRGDEQKESETERLKKTTLHLQELSKFLAQNDWIAGKQITWVDFLVYEILYHHRNCHPNVLDNHQNLQQYMERFEQLPKIKEYMNSSNYVKNRFNNKNVKYGG